MMRIRLSLLVATLGLIGLVVWQLQDRQVNRQQDQTSQQIAQSTQVTADAVQSLAKTVTQGSAQSVEQTAQIVASVAQVQQQVVRIETRTGQIEDAAQVLQRRVAKLEDTVNNPGYVAMMMSDLKLGSSVRTWVTEAYYSNGVIAGSNAELGLPVAADWHGQSLRETHVRQGGVIELIFDEKSGVDAGMIRFVPDMDLVERGGPMNWQCETSDYPNIETLLPSCRFTGQR